MILIIIIIIVVITYILNEISEKYIFKKMNGLD